jgi:predicted ATP-grasp superfamily ATP-dependent carboligase
MDVGRRFDLRDWVLFPTRDETVMAFSKQLHRLASFFRVTTPAWETTRFVWDKANTYKLAEELGIPAPRTWYIQSADQLESLYPYLPLAIKPAIKENFFYATGDKAWRVETPEQLRDLFLAASKKLNWKRS